MQSRPTVLLLIAAAALPGVGASCNDAERVPPARDEPARPAEPATPHEGVALPETGTPTDPEIFLPPLDGYRVDDDAEVGEIQASLDHGPVPYHGVRRRLILDEQGFTLGEVMVVTFQPETDGPERFLRHWFGDTVRTPVEIGGVDMLRIPTSAHDATAWVGPEFVVTFARGQAVTHEWLEDLARATVAAVRP